MQKEQWVGTCLNAAMLSIIIVTTAAKTSAMNRMKKMKDALETPGRVKMRNNRRFVERGYAMRSSIGAGQNGMVVEVNLWETWTSGLEERRLEARGVWCRWGGGLEGEWGGRL